MFVSVETLKAGMKLHHHMRHLSVGFIGDPFGHLKASANSGLFTKVPLTLNGPGMCGLVSSDVAMYSAVKWEHHS